MNGVNAPPIIDLIANSSTSQLHNPSITLAGKAAINFSFTVSDAEGTADINISTAKASFQRSGEDIRNASCSKQENIDTDTTNFTCVIDIWYWDGAGAWSVNVTIMDNSSEKAENHTANFSLQETTGMAMAPSALTWSSMALTAANQTATQNLTINHTGLNYR